MKSDEGQSPQPKQLRWFEDLAPDDLRRLSPRFQGESFHRNLDLVQRVEEMAVQKHRS